MNDPRHDSVDDDGRTPVDPLINDANREGLTGTTPATLYGRLPVREQITIPPDGRPSDAQPQWRQDFPIDWPQDQYVARRDFTKFLVLTSFAFVVGQVWIGVQNFFRRRRGGPVIRKVVALADLAVGGSIVFDYPTAHDPCLLIRTAEDRLLAYSQSCTHLACAVVPRPAEHCIHCPCHNGYFDLQSGRPTAGPPRRPLPKVLLEVRQGVVYATGIERRTV
jgi:Rieske Fe-S protein